MRECVAGCGGTFGAGPRSDGGWQITARFPHYAQTRDGGEQLTVLDPARR
jgi:hypothetical protein